MTKQKRYEAKLYFLNSKQIPQQGKNQIVRLYKAQFGLVMKCKKKKISITFSNYFPGSFFFHFSKPEKTKTHPKTKSPYYF